MKKIWTVAIVAVATALAAVPAYALPVGVPNQISNFDVPVNMDNCGGPAVADNEVNGLTLAAWTNDLGDVATNDLEYTFLGEDGTGGEIFSYSEEGASIPRLGDCEPVAVEAAPDGSFFVVWTWDEYLNGVVIDAEGNASDFFEVSSARQYDDIETIDIVWSSEHQKYLVAWKAYIESDFPAASAYQQIVGRFFDESATAVGTDFLITDEPNEFDNSIDLSFGDGVWAVVGGYDNGNKAYVTFIEGDGTTSNPAPCSANDSTTSSASLEYNEVSNSFLCVWKSGTTVKGNFISTDGTLSEVADLVIVDSNVRAKPRAVSLDDDGWFITWHTTDQMEVFGAQVGLDGTLVGDATLISAGVNDDELEMNFRPAVAFSRATGHVYVAWVRYDSVIQETEVYARAWYIREGEGILADTGINAGLLVAGAAGLVAAGVALRRRLSA